MSHWETRNDEIIFVLFVRYFHPGLFNRAPKRSPVTPTGVSPIDAVVYQTARWKIDGKTRWTKGQGRGRVAGNREILSPRGDSQRSRSLTSNSPSSLSSSPYASGCIRIIRSRCRPECTYVHTHVQFSSSPRSSPTISLPSRDLSSHQKKLPASSRPYEGREVLLDRLLLAFEEAGSPPFV